MDEANCQKSKTLSASGAASSAPKPVKTQTKPGQEPKEAEPAAAAEPAADSSASASGITPTLGLDKDEYTIGEIVGEQRAEIAATRMKFVVVLEQWISALLFLFPQDDVLQTLQGAIALAKAVPTEHEGLVSAWREATTPIKDRLRECDIEALWNLDWDLLKDVDFRGKYVKMSRKQSNIDTNWRYVHRLMDLEETLEAFNAKLPKSMVKRMMDTATDVFGDFASGKIAFEDIDLEELGNRVLENADGADIATMVSQLPMLHKSTLSMVQSDQYRNARA